MSRFFLNLIDNYIHEARQTFNITLWKCDVYDTSPHWDQKADKQDRKRSRHGPSGISTPYAIKDEPSQTFPFFQRLEIGYGAEMARYCQTEEARMRKQMRFLSRKHQLSTQEAKQLWHLRSELRPENEESRRKNLEAKFAKERAQTPEVKVRFVKVGLDGKAVKILHEPQYMAFSQLTLTNVPVHNDKDTFPPNPEDSWLELYAKAAPSYSSRKNVLNAEPTQHVSRVEISVRGTDRFSVLVDGQLFPQGGGSSRNGSVGYRSLVVDKLCNTNEEQLKFPVRTFFPIKP
eukprot:CAMPEP_0170177036 /NCGR_PEP_ID=MMETSP0040_2-20121228/9772_1 /TAXON_ID=641309 /ORGANISM="Lotharella oceanica, Strain CCMP622" /LENGTH=288 /DNA_ID=CAMNT_0010419533 /DNA_START=326 /DNA_END=1192 /DNA_ORIENTATION=+